MSLRHYPTSVDSRVMIATPLQGDRQIKILYADVMSYYVSRILAYINYCAKIASSCYYIAELHRHDFMYENRIHHGLRN